MWAKKRAEIAMELWTQSSCNTFDSFRRSHYGCTSCIDVVYYPKHPKSMIFLRWFLCFASWDLKSRISWSWGHCAQGDSCILVAVLIKIVKPNDDVDVSNSSVPFLPLADVRDFYRLARKHSRQGRMIIGSKPPPLGS